MNAPNLKRINSQIPFHMVKLGNYFIHIIDTSRVLQKIAEGHVKVIKGEDKGFVFPYYGGYQGHEYTELNA